MLRAADHGFQIVFKNEVTVSVMWGEDNYCDNKHKATRTKELCFINSCRNAEVRIWDKNSKWITSDIIKQCFPLEAYGDHFRAVGWIEADKIAQILVKASEWKEEE